MLAVTTLGLLVGAVKYGICASLAAGLIRLFHRGDDTLKMSYVLAIGFLVGLAYGAVVGIFDSMMARF